MKKILILSLFLFTSIVSYSQANFYKIEKITILNYINETWTVNKTVEPIDEFVIIEGNKINLVSKNLKLSYIIYGEKTVKDYETHIATHWSGYDNEGKDCVVMIKNYRDFDQKSINLIYGLKSLAIELIIKEQ